MHDTPAPAASPSALPSVRRIALVAAVARNGVIGLGGALPWRIPEDLRRFRALTTGHTIVMGRRTWESLGRPLPDRQNIVVSRRLDGSPPGAAVARSVADAVAMARLPDPICVIGGSELYRAALPISSLLYLTEIHREFAGDTYFPAYDRSAWLEVARESGQSEVPSMVAYDFVTYERDSA